MTARSEERRRSWQGTKEGGRRRTSFDAIKTGDVDFEEAAATAAVCRPTASGDIIAEDDASREEDASIRMILKREAKKKKEGKDEK